MGAKAVAFVLFSCCSTLDVLCAVAVYQYPAMTDLSLYHTPDLRGITKAILKPPFNETIGLTHMKVYLFDDTVLLSGCVTTFAEPMALT
jgi:hypothetical protein